MVNYWGDRAVDIAVQKQVKVETLRMIIEAGADMKVNSYAHLYLATLNGNSQHVKLLLEKGADVNDLSRNGQTILFSAAKNNKECIKLLLMAGAPVNRIDNKGKKGPGFVSQLRSQIFSS